uniref:F-box domain-containing protein n=1 Tax=Oryza barthii TaxID=65489 RepID=A0A0D3FMZ3_9ORYZ
MATPSCPLTIDDLLHVLLHLDPRSIVRCAAVSKYWRRAVIVNASQVRRHANRQADRRLLLGYHYREVYPGRLRFSARSTWSPSTGHQHWSDHLPVPSFAPAAAAADGGHPERMYAQLACSDGLLLACRGILEEVSVYSPLTGFHATMPRYDELLTDTYFLHSVHGDEMNPTPNSFQVLAVEVEPEGELALQNYSSETGAWGPVIRPVNDKVLMPRVIHYPVAAIECQADGGSPFSGGRMHARRCRHGYTLKKTVAVVVVAATATTARRDGFFHGLLTSGSSSSMLVWHIFDRSTKIGQIWRSRCVVIWVPYLGLFVLDLENMQMQRAAGDSQTHVWPYEMDLTRWWKLRDGRGGEDREKRDGRPDIVKDDPKRRKVKIS